MNEYIDIGVNLFSKQFKGKEEIIINNSLENNVTVIITGSSKRSSVLASQFTKNLVGIYATAGIHPHSVKDCNEETINDLKTMILNNKNIVAVGECGLDYNRMYSPKETQIEWFKQQIELAEELNKPLFLHERDAVDDFYQIMKRHKKICEKSVVHCFTGNKETVLKYLNLGCFIGITGWICDERRNKELLESIKLIPINRLMIETDAPYLTPKNINGLKSTNVPENIKYVLSEIAKLREIDESILKEQIYNNTKEFFGI